jgi:hypothetical protein
MRNQKERQVNMFDQHSRYTQELEGQARRNQIRSEFEKAKMVKRFKQAQDSEVIGATPRQRLGRVIIKLGIWLASNPHLNQV